MTLTDRGSSNGLVTALQELLDALDRREAAKAKRILVEHPYLFHWDVPFGWPVIHRCVASDCIDLELLNLYAESGASLNRKTEAGLSLLGLAARKLFTGPLIDKMRELGASMSGFEECVAILANETDHSRGERRIRALLGSDERIVSAAGDDGLTLLHHAVTNGLPWAVRLFISAGCPANALSAKGLTALDSCPGVSPKDQEIADMLVKANATRTPLGEIVHRMRSGRSAEAVSLLTANRQLRRAWFPGLGPLILLTAWLAPDDQVLRFLLEFGVDPNEPNERGDVALHMAWTRGETVKLLLEHGADASRQNASGDTPLHKAIALNNTEPILVLVDHRTGINIVNGDNETPLDIVHRLKYPDYRHLAKLIRSCGGRLGKELQQAVQKDPGRVE